MSNQYQLTKQLGLEILTTEIQTRTPTSHGEGYRVSFKQEDFVKASDLEKILADGVRVYGEETCRFDLTMMQTSADTHSGLLIGYKEIEKPKAVSKSELSEFFKLIAPRYDTIDFTNKVNELLKRIEQSGVSND